MGQGPSDLTPPEARRARRVVAGQVARRLPAAEAVPELGKIVREPQRDLDVRRVRVAPRVLDDRKAQADRDGRAAEKVLGAHSDPVALAVSAGQSARRVTVGDSAGPVDPDARRVSVVGSIGQADPDARRAIAVDMARVRLDRRVLVPVVRKPPVAHPGSKAARRPAARPASRNVRRDETRAVPEVVVGSLEVDAHREVREGRRSAVAPIPAGDTPAALKTAARIAAAESANVTTVSSLKHPVPAHSARAGC